MITLHQTQRLLGCFLLLTMLAQASSAQECVVIPRRIPPQGQTASTSLRDGWESKIARLANRLEELMRARRDTAFPLQNFEGDVGVLLKACRFAMDHDEFYRKSDFAKVDRLLELVQARLEQLERGSAGWTEMEGFQVRGFRSAIDDSFQPVGLVFPESGLGAQSKLYPLYVWLHGRGDKTTDLHFIHDRLDKAGQIRPKNSIVLHPFGRQCVGYKSAGETDVMEAIDFVCRHYPVDRTRIVLMGFSMGGAGVWHLAAHYGERFVAASPGAGFAETARYQRLKPEDFPPIYEQILWKHYDVPGYVRNLFDLPVVAYSGENDKQIQAARVMEEAFRSQGRTLPHLIGPGMGHKYHPDTLVELLSKMESAAEGQLGQAKTPESIHLQSPVLRYAKRAWITVDGMERQYEDTRVDAIRTSDGTWALSTKNVNRLQINGRSLDPIRQKFKVDGQEFQSQATLQLFEKQNDSWVETEAFPKLRKHPGLSGPVDDAFIDPFLVVGPDSPGTSSVDRWAACEFEFLKSRWRSLFRGDLRVKQAEEVTNDDLARFHIVVFGTPATNSLLRRALETEGLPMTWTTAELKLGEDSLKADQAVPVMIYPNPLSHDRYLVINSGPTFRPAHDRTNSLQNPHLPDWAVLSLEAPRTDERAGKVLKAGFFNDQWQFDGGLTW